MFAGAPVAVCRDKQISAGVHNPIPQGLCGETTEHDRMDRADTGAGQHGNGQLGDHGQVDCDPVALLDALLLQDVCKLRSLYEQLLEVIFLTSSSGSP